MFNAVDIQLFHFEVTHSNYREGKVDGEKLWILTYFTYEPPGDHAEMSNCKIQEACHGPDIVDLSSTE